MNYYNDNDPKICAWLRELIKANLIPPGEVDERSILDVQPDDLSKFTQCHFFAGIAGWAYALQLAGWPTDRPCWTGSCPCQPFSVGSVGHGGAKGQNDERHLWPAWFSLIQKRNPPVIFGEQVASAVNWGWVDRLAMDLESESYAFASAVLRADAFGASHQRKRIYWVADSNGEGWKGHKPEQRIPLATPTTLSIYGNSFAGARCALDGDYSHLLPCDGLSVVMERHAIKGYGNSIVPQVAAEFVAAFIDAL